MAEQITCRHGVALCYRCGVGPNVSEQKFAKMVTADEQFEHLSANSPAPRPSRRDDVLPEKKSKPKKRRLAPCIHRGEYVGTLDCACDGARDTYRCTKIHRPDHPEEYAFCIEVLTSKPYSRIVDSKTKRTLHRVKNREVILCTERHTIEMNGTENSVGCPSYSPTEG
jgi:hypothetical protein